MGVKYYKLQRFTPTLSGNSGESFALSAVPDRGVTGWNYIRRVNISARINFSTSSGGTIAAGNELRILSRAVLSIPGVGVLVNNVDGLDLHNAHALRHGHWPVNPGAALTSTSAIRDLLWVIDFDDPQGVKSSDGAHPARVFQDTKLDVTIAAAADITGLNAIDTASMDVYLDMVERDELRVPSPVAYSWEEPTGTDVYLAPEGAYQGLLVTPTHTGDGQTWVAADYNLLGVQIGDYTVWDQQTRQRDIMKIWNAHMRDRAAGGAPGSVLAFPIDGGGAANNSTFIALLWARDASKGGEGSHFATLDSVPALVRPRIIVDAAATRMRFNKLVRWFHGPWSRAYAERIGISAPQDQLTPKTASKVAAMQDRVKALVAKKES